jgi:AdoMet-dependent rRNA methyltransferase SPB1
MYGCMGVCVHESVRACLTPPSYVKHPATTTEIKALCADLKVLSKTDFKTLLRWRLKMVMYKDQLVRERKAAEMDEGEEEADGDADGMHQDDEDEEEDEDEDMGPRGAKGGKAILSAEERRAKDDEQANAEMDELEAHLSKQAKRAKKKEREKKAKLRERIQHGGTDMDR